MSTSPKATDTADKSVVEAEDEAPVKLSKEHYDDDLFRLEQIFDHAPLLLQQPTWVVKAALRSAKDPISIIEAGEIVQKFLAGEVKHAKVKA